MQRLGGTVLINESGQKKKRSEREKGLLESG